MDNSIVLFRVRWAIRIGAVTSLLGVLLALFFVVQSARRQAIISSNVGRLTQIQLAVENTLDSSGCPFTDLAPDETWKRILSREALSDSEPISSIFEPLQKERERRSDIVAIRLPGMSQQDCLADYELICVERPELYLAADAPALFTLKEFCAQAAALIRQRPDAAKSYLIAVRLEHRPQVETLREYVEHLQPIANQTKNRAKTSP